MVRYAVDAIVCTPVACGIRRSISIFDGKTGELVWDSGDFIGRFTADPANGFSDIFNSEGGENLLCVPGVPLFALAPALDINCAKYVEQPHFFASRILRHRNVEL